MQYHPHILHAVAASKRADLVRAADAYRLAAAASGIPEPGSPRRWLGDRLVALGELIAAEPAPAPPRHSSRY
jgi:hypothetical protein